MKPLTPDESLAVLAKLPTDSPVGRALKETMVDAMALRQYVRALKRRIRLARAVLDGRRVMNEDDAVIPRDTALAELLDLRVPLASPRPVSREPKACAACRIGPTVAPRPVSRKKRAGRP